MSIDYSSSEENNLERFLSQLLHADVIFSQVGERIDEIANLRGLKSDKAFGKEIGISQPMAWRFRSGQGIEGNLAILTKIAALDPQRRGLRWLLGGDKALHQLLMEREESREKLQALVRAAQLVARELEQIATE